MAPPALRGVDCKPQNWCTYIPAWKKHHARQREDDTTRTADTIAAKYVRAREATPEIMMPALA